ncbi:MAG: hypothetical protein ACREXU_08525, partial [Gammaproteobacteria bacterium]
MNDPVWVHAPQTPGAAVVVEGIGGDPNTAPDLMLTVHVEREGQPGTQPVQGRYRRAGSRIEFKPLYPFIGGQRYHVHISGHHAGTFALPPTGTAPAPHVLAIHPTAPVIPANILRLYVTFSAPMQRQQAHRHVDLTDDHGRDASTLIVDLGHELWSPDSTRLTLLLDPGTSKRGIHT